MGTFAYFMDPGEVTLVDVEVVRLLTESEDRGIVLVHCPPYVREWILRERAEGAQPKFRMVCDSTRGYLFRSSRAVLAIEFSLRCLGEPNLKR